MACQEMLQYAQVLAGQPALREHGRQVAPVVGQHERPVRQVAHEVEQPEKPEDTLVEQPCSLEAWEARIPIQVSV